MLDQKDIKEMHYFKNLISIEEIKKGYDGRKKYKIVTKNQNYFIKILHYKLNEEEIMKEKILYETYKNLKISIVPLLDLIEYKNQTIFIYPFFEGKSLNDATLTTKEYYKYGVQVGQDIIKLQKSLSDSKLFSLLNIDEHFKRYQEDIKKLWKDINYQQKILEIFSIEELKSLSILYKNLLEDIKKQKFLLNHNDIKTANIMLDKDNNYYFIDIDPMDLTPAGFNVHYSIYSFLLYGFKENEKSFLRGFIQTIDPNKEILEQLQFFLIVDMINESKSLLTKYFSKIKENKQYIKKMLFNKEKVLEKMIYNEK